LGFLQKVNAKLIVKRLIYTFKIWIIYLLLHTFAKE